MTEIATEFWRTYNNVEREQKASEREWVARLRGEGVKAAHPDDGWVYRDRNEMTLCYPQFNDGLEIGSRLALGYHFDATRIVEVTGFRENRANGDARFYVQFKEID